MQGPEVLIPLTMFAGGFALVFGIVYLRSRENMAMIEKGMNPKRHANLPAPFRSLKTGLLLLGAGIGLLLAFFISRNLPANDENSMIYFSLVAIGGGLGLVISYGMEKKDYDRSRNLPE